MIKYALKCEGCEAGFDGWFSSSSAFDDQRAAGVLTCPHCGASKIVKQIMAPAVLGARQTEAARLSQAEKFAAMAKAIREHVGKTHEYVGDAFADRVRAMYYGEEAEKPVWGETTVHEATELAKEGIPALPLPPPMVPERAADPKKLN